jgi:hypothetical protein
MWEIPPRLLGLAGECGLRVNPPKSGAARGATQRARIQALFVAPPSSGRRISEARRRWARPGSGVGLKPSNPNNHKRRQPERARSGSCGTALRGHGGRSRTPLPDFPCRRAGPERHRPDIPRHEAVRRNHGSGADRDSPEDDRATPRPGSLSGADRPQGVGSLPDGPWGAIPWSASRIPNCSPMCT